MTPKKKAIEIRKLEDMCKWYFEKVKEQQKEIDKLGKLLSLTADTFPNWNFTWANRLEEKMIFTTLCNRFH